jgi:hypothetical protein
VEDVTHLGVTLALLKVSLGLLGLVTSDSTDNRVLLAANLVSETGSSAPVPCRVGQSLPLGVALGLGGLDLCLALGVLLLTGGGEGGWLAGATDSLVGSLDTASNDLLCGSDDGVELVVSDARVRRARW